jgi:DNA-binding NarL/FixJ family response regulator
LGEGEVRILVADDSDVVRRAIVALLSKEPDVEVCGEAGGGVETLQKARELRPGVIVIDVSMPDIGGLETARLLRQDFPDTKIIVISQNDPAVLMSGVRNAGADACVDKSRLATDLINTIRMCEVRPFLRQAID